MFSSQVMVAKNKIFLTKKFIVNVQSWIIQNKHIILEKIELSTRDRSHLFKLLFLGFFICHRIGTDDSKFFIGIKFLINDNMVAAPASVEEAPNVEILRGPNIKPFPVNSPLAESIECDVTLKVGDNITTDHIMPAGAKILPLRSNIPAISEYCFTVCDETFPKRAKEAGKGIIVGGVNYGQGSSREHAALAPLYLGVKAIICKSFARIHRQNLINNGILPLEFVNEADYERIAQGDSLAIANIRDIIEKDGKIIVENKTKGESYEVRCELSERGKGMILAGGLLNMTKNG